VGNDLPDEGRVLVTGEPKSSDDERLAALDRRVDALLEAHQEQLRAMARESGRPRGGTPIRQAEARLREEIRSLEEKVTAMEERQRVERARRRNRHVRLSDVGKLVRQARRLTRSKGADDFGFDRDFYDTLEPFLKFLYERYFRVEAEGAAAGVPEEGPAILVANRGGLFNYDALMIAESVRRAHPFRRVRFLLDEFASSVPGLPPLLVRLGGIRAHADNVRRLLERGEAVLFFPEGRRAATKLLAERYRLGPMAPDFAKLALQLGTPVIPVAILGPEESQPVLGRAEWLARLLRVAEIPLAPTGMLPLPVKFKIRFGEPVPMTRGRGDARSRARAEALRDRVRTRIVEMLRDLKTARRSVFLG
jgi:1-acyl-sn-glycerol-3-phosphate acyltransferase